MKIRTENLKRLNYKTPDSFESPNLNYAFNTEYQETAVFLNQTNPAGLPDKVLASIGNNLNKSFLAAANNNAAVQDMLEYGNRMTEFYKDIKVKQFSVYVCYPGLQIGTGYPHKTKQIKGEIQVGALFDWATGVPYYPGSSVKGVLRNLFKIASGDGAEAEGCRYDFTQRINAVNPGIDWKITKENAEYLKNILFGKDPDKQSLVSINDRNIFYDAYIVGFRKNASGQQQKILGIDSLAPHESRTKNPTPISMLRILPDVCLTFNMHLNDVKDPDGKVLLTCEQLLALFKGIILDIGFGAKTHTGYGVVKEIEQEDILCEVSYQHEDHHGADRKIEDKDADLSKGSQNTPYSSREFNNGLKKLSADLIDPSSNYKNTPQRQQSPNGHLRCPKCGSEIIETNTGRILCKGKCGMLYGKAFGEDLSLEQTKQLLEGVEIRTLKGRSLSIDINDSYEEFTTSNGQTKYRLKFCTPEK